MKEQRRYRAWKWVVQQLTFRRGANQLDRLTETDWDILVVLDACRADVLDELAQWPVETTTSPAGCTPEWLEATTDAGLFEDTHVVSGNPQYEQTAVEFGYRSIEPFWEDEWDESLQTVPPEPILDRVTELFTDDGSQIVAHLQQPHWPYVAKLGDSWELAYPELGPWRDSPEEITSLQVAMQRGHINLDRAYSAYRASVASVWTTLTTYLQQWHEAGGHVVVTADHGETFGRLSDLKLYEHPCNCHVSPVITVPWVEFAPSTTASQQSGEIEDRLEALGYVG